MEVAKILISLSEDSPFIEESVLNCVRGIIAKVKEEDPDVEYSDNAYRELYVMCQDFSRRIEDVLASEASTQDSSVFGTAINYNYFNQQRMF